VPIPEVIMGMNATLLGMQSVNPQARLKFVIINSWYDPGKEGDAAKALLDQGCDILAQHTDSPAPLQVAEQRGLKAFGESTDMIRFAEKSQVTAPVNNWGPYYIERVQALIDGKWASSDVWGGLKSTMLEMAPYRNVSDEVVAFATKLEADVREGRVLPFAGPVKDQSGTERIAAGQSPDDAAIASMNWLAQGIDGKLPS
jgi:simple sugar transport system substrate-binding protein